MPVVDQPSGMVAGNGVIITVGIRCNGDRAAIVMPFCLDGAPAGPKNICHDCVTDFAGAPLTALLDCLSSDAIVSFIQGEGMVDGRVPFRIDYDATENPGTRGAGCETSQVGAVIGFYIEPDDLAPGARMAFAKNIIPGVADGDITADDVAASLVTALEAFALIVADGFTNTGADGGTWYRIMADVVGNSPGAPVRRVGVWVVRGYTGTQRRRLLPH